MGKFDTWCLVVVFCSINSLPQQFASMVLVTQAKECIKSQETRNKLLIAFVLFMLTVGVFIFGFAGQAEMAGDVVRRRVLLQAGMTFCSAAFVIYSVVFIYFTLAFFKVFKISDLRSSLSKEDIEASKLNLIKVKISPPPLCQLSIPLFNRFG